MIDYLSHRLTMAGYGGGELFQISAIKLLHRYSRGIPRLINLIVHKALILCYGKGDKQITKAIMKQAINDTEDAYIDQNHNVYLSRFITISLILTSTLAMAYWMI